MTLFEPLRVQKIDIEDVEAYAVNGTPTDSVVIGMYVIMAGSKPDLVISGINIGENLSYEAATTSGTIGAAMEAANQGVPAIAISLHVADEGDKFADTTSMRNYAMVQSVVRTLAQFVLDNGLPNGIDLLNVNVPARVTRDTPVVMTRLARRMYDTIVHHRTDPRGRSYYWVDGIVVEDALEGTDLHVVHKKGQISITPMRLDMTALPNASDDLEKALGQLFRR